MQLAIFDIDGTLTDTMNLDDTLYQEVLKSNLNINLSYKTWENYKSISTGTDSGIAFEIIKNELKIIWAINYFGFLKYTFLKSLQNSFFGMPFLFKEIQGAKQFFDELQSNNQFQVGIATGSWKESGIIKLNSIGINHLCCPYGHADLFRRRSEIISYVITESMKKNDVEEFSKITYFGDGVWDYLASKELGINFIGVDNKFDGKLKSLGVQTIINDFKDKELLYGLLS